MSKNVLVINGADFSQCAVDVYSVLDYKKSEYAQTNGYYGGKVTVGTTTIDSLFNENPGYYSYLFPVSQVDKYIIKSRYFGQGVGIVSWALVDSNDIILDYGVVPNGGQISEVVVETSEYQTASKLLICCSSGGTWPKVVYIEEN